MYDAQQISIKGAYTARTLSVRSSLQNMAEEELPELVVVCARLVSPVTRHLELCFQMPGMMVGMDQMDG